MGYSPWGCKESDTTEQLNNFYGGKTTGLACWIVNSQKFLYKKSETLVSLPIIHYRNTNFYNQYKSYRTPEVHIFLILVALHYFTWN